MAEREEESGHRAALIQTYRERFGEHIPLIRHQDVKASASEDAGATVKLLRADLVVIVILVRRVWRSSTKVERPVRARYAAAVKPLCPAPITIASRVCWVGLVITNDRGLKISDCR